MLTILGHYEVPQKRLKTGFFNTLNVISAVTTFVTLSLTGTVNQIVMGTGTTTTVNAPTPGQNQQVTIPDSGSSTTFVEIVLSNACDSSSISASVEQDYYFLNQPWNEKSGEVDSVKSCKNKKLNS